MQARICRRRAFGVRTSTALRAIADSPVARPTRPVPRCPSCTASDQRRKGTWTSPAGAGCASRRTTRPSTRSSSVLAAESGSKNRSSYSIASASPCRTPAHAQSCPVPRRARRSGPARSAQRAGPRSALTKLWARMAGEEVQRGWSHAILARGHRQAHERRGHQTQCFSGLRALPRTSARCRLARNRVGASHALFPGLFLNSKKTKSRMSQEPSQHTPGTPGDITCPRLALPTAPRSSSIQGTRGAHRGRSAGERAAAGFTGIVWSGATTTRAGVGGRSRAPRGGVGRMFAYVCIEMCVFACVSVPTRASILVHLWQCA